MLFLISIIIILILIIIIISYRASIRPILLQKKSLDLTYDNLKSGDIILYRNNKTSIVTNLIFGDLYSHSGIIYEKDNIKYVVESHFRRLHTNSNDVNLPTKLLISPVKSHFSLYNGLIYVLPLNKPLDATRLKTLDDLINNKYSHLTFKVKINEYIDKCILSIGPRSIDTPEQSIHCSEFVASILSDINIIKLNTHAICIRPNCYIKLFKHAKYVDGYQYDPTNMYSVIF